ncbi:Stp1/IreP family PP2C-type Ser/Thr phosphatase [Calothrix sp. NIES-3974]|uniref:Stp1/IreP family PP2C-type Ser/Thr phosphatase n=1 Tax=Calothrix sp. NIES-3974 TaxID=2005462 RepID=UPI000B607BEF|nr:Stp1/IreP family PP2C-type Ser/Thr phosphatase [Calothrix sp. NIES-3974]BAZ06690.1 protein-serine/threonine phosphatase [Calothrix sp. NIES-3974]
MKLLFFGASDVGLVRLSNQDAHYIDKNGKFFIVADGMGGHAGGEEASRIATEEIQAYISENWDSPKTSPQLLEGALIQANAAILADQHEHPERADMGTTVVGVMFRNDEPYCVHIGDSRLYRFRSGQLEQMTEDHTWVSRAIKLGDMTVEEAREHPLRHVLSRCLGREEMQNFDIQQLDIQVGDILLLCSDGLTEELSNQEIVSQLQTHGSNLEQAAQNLIEAAKSKGGHDNITLILVAVEE